MHSPLIKFKSFIFSELEMGIQRIFLLVSTAFATTTTTTTTNLQRVLKSEQPISNMPHESKFTKICEKALDDEISIRDLM